jgi:hypothetical protein
VSAALTAGFAAGEGIPVVGWHSQAAGWEAESVGLHERTVMLGVVLGGCGYRNVRAVVRERHATIAIEVRDEVPEYARPISCPAPRRDPLTISLKRALAGRRLLGASKLEIGTLVGVVSVKVPGVIGFAPGDAERSLAIAHLRRRVKVELARGLRRVVSQTPGAGGLVALNGVVTLRVAGRANGQ